MAYLYLTTVLVATPPKFSEGLIAMTLLSREDEIYPYKPRYLLA